MWRLEVSISITGKQRHADWHDGGMPQVRPTLAGGTWDDKAFIEERRAKRFSTAARRKAEAATSRRAVSPEVDGAKGERHR